MIHLDCPQEERSIAGGSKARGCPLTPSYFEDELYPFRPSMDQRLRDSFPSDEQKKPAMRQSACFSSLSKLPSEPGHSGCPSSEEQIPQVIGKG